MHTFYIFDIFKIQWMIHKKKLCFLLFLELDRPWSLWTVMIFNSADKDINSIDAF